MAEAVEKEEKGKIKELVSKNDLDLNTFMGDEMSVDYCTLGYQTYLLIRSMRVMKIDMLKFLVDDCGADVNVKDETGNTPVIEAAFRGKSQHVDFLCKRGANTDGEKCLEGECITVWWNYNNDDDTNESTGTRVWDTLISNGVKTWNKDPAVVVLGAHDWEEEGLKYIQLLLKKGENVNAQASNGKTVLMSALHKGNYKIVNMLLRRKATDIHLKDEDGETALFYAVYDDAMLGNYDPEPEDLRYMVRKRIEAIKKLITKGADIHARNNNGNTLLMEAARCESTLLAEFFLKQGLDVHAENNSGQTAISRWFTHGNDKMEKLLTKYGAKPYPKKDE